jgi:hypothetical protein
MKINALLKIHDRFQPAHSLKNNLGDGFLLTFNPIYRVIREESLKAKFKFSAKRFYDYDSLALTQLPKILEKKIIPYVDNVSPIREIEQKLPRYFSLSDLPPLRANQIFHESAHAVAHSLLSKRVRAPKVTAQKKEEALILNTFLEESFANACESIANIYSHDEMHDEFLYKNVYIMDTVKIRSLLSRAVLEFGFAETFQILLFSFLHANFLYTKVDANSFNRVIKLIFKTKPKQMSLAKTVFKTGLSLDPEFTLFTNAFCLRLLGVKNQKSLQFDFLSYLEGDTAYRGIGLALSFEISKGSTHAIPAFTP